MYVTVFCGSSVGHDPDFASNTRQLGQALVQNKLDLVYGGGRVGLMGILADTVMNAGGKVTGIIPEFLATTERAHQQITDLQVVQTMHQRKAKMAEMGSAFIALPGGIGTLEELIEILTWRQLGRHQKPCWILDVNGYWQPLLKIFQHARLAGFLRPDDHELLSWSDEPLDLVQRLIRQIDDT